MDELERERNDSLFGTGEGELSVNSMKKDLESGEAENGSIGCLNETSSELHGS